MPALTTTPTLRVLTKLRDQMKALQSESWSDAIARGSALAEAVELLDDAIVEELRAPAALEPSE